MSKNTLPVSESKFTKGEKCIFTHLVLTFSFILILVIIYAIHLYRINHTQYGIFNTRRTSFDTKRISRPESLLVGYLYLNITNLKFVCNTLLLTSRWSLCTAHCVAVRTEPDVAHLLFTWRLKYKLVTKEIADQQTTTFVTPIKRSIAHSLFSRETFANNIGLLEHTVSHPFLSPDFNNAIFTSKSEDRKNMFVISWNNREHKNTDNRKIESISYDAHHVSTENCLDAVSVVTMVRNYEFCVKLQEKSQIFLDYGAVVFSNSKIMGIFSWGERLQKELPMVIINITLFQDWYRAIASI